VEAALGPDGAAGGNDQGGPRQRGGRGQEPTSGERPAHRWILRGAGGEISPGAHSVARAYTSRSARGNGARAAVPTLPAARKRRARVARRPSPSRSPPFEPGGGSASLPALGDVHVGAIEGGHGRAAEQSERALQVDPEDLDGSGDAGLAGGGEAIRVRATAEDGASAETEALDDVGPAANAAVHEDLDPAVHGGDHFGKRSERRRHPVEL